MDAFKLAIKEYLDQRANSDSLFAVTYKKDGKSIDDCIKYIISQVQKSGRSGFANDEIYSLAVHYYDEADIAIPASVPTPRVVITDDRITPEASDPKPVMAKVVKKPAKKQEARVIDFDKRQLSLF